MSNLVRYSSSPAPWVPGALLHKNDCLPALRAMPDASISCVITDPPYGLSDVKSAEVVQAITDWAQSDRERVPDGRGFMGNEWDRFVPPPAVWDECMRVLKPGGYMAVFAGSRTADLMGLSIRLAGFEMRDTITWLYGSGFPKSLDVGKAIDKAAGAVREVIGFNPRAAQQTPKHRTASYGEYNGTSEALTAPATEAAKQWDGWGTALKPAAEPIIMARKPFPETVAANVLAHSTGAINIDGCRVITSDKLIRPAILRGENKVFRKGLGAGTQNEPSGRWPSNVVLSHSELCDETKGCVEGCPIAELDAQSGITKDEGYGGQGGASRFFNTFRYQAKAPTSERPVVNGVAHPTVKPLALMEWLVTLLTPPYGVILDCFAGSGTVGHAGLRLGFNSIIIERDAKYWPLIDARFSKYLNSTRKEVG